MTEIFTQAALATRSLPELRCIFQKVQQDLGRCEIGSSDHFTAAQNLMNVRRAIAAHTSRGPRR